MTTKILFVGDIHLGRTPHRLRQLGKPLSELSPQQAWRNTVRFALQHKVEAVVLAGDVVDHEKDRFEAWNMLRDGVSQLVQHDVKVFSVVGNHDYNVLPKLEERIQGFRVIGKNKTWERIELSECDIVGWSFNTRHHSQNPILSEGFETVIQNQRSTHPSIVVIHADLDVSKSLYAPITTQDLKSMNVNAAVLGHIHKPSFNEDNPFGYLGSLVGLNRGEIGKRGPWLCTIENSELRFEQIPIGPVYWDDIRIDVSNMKYEEVTIDTLHAEVTERITDFVQASPWISHPNIEVFGVTIDFIGYSEIDEHLETFINSFSDEYINMMEVGTSVLVVKMKNKTETKSNIAELAIQNNPLGRLAKLIHDVEGEGIEIIPDDIHQVFDSFKPSHWRVSEEDYPMPEFTEIFQQEAKILLHELEQQRGSHVS